MLKDALFYEKYNNRVKCFLCPHNCSIPEGKYGLCSVRVNKGGVLKTVNYGEITSIALDPIEKKPLYHFKPGKSILSVGSFGCNFTCSFCQNYSISQHRASSRYTSPNELIDISLNLEGNIGIAFTYNEPSICYEYVYDTSKKLKENCPDLSIVLVTNGYIEEEPLLKLLPYVDAMNIDLKSFKEDYYRKICGGEIEPVLKTIENSYKACHIEITTLLVNGLNDSEEEVKEIASYIGDLDKAGKYLAYSVILVGFVLTFATVFTTAVIGELTNYLTFPFFELARCITIGRFIERMEALVLVMWVAGVTIKVATFFYLASLGTGQLFGLSDYRPIVLPIGLLLGVWSLELFENSTQVNQWLSKVLPPYAFIFELGIPLVLLIIAALTKKGGQQSHE